MKCKCYSSYTAPAYIWAFLSIIAAILCPFGLYFSNWLEKPVGINGDFWDSVSSFRVCKNESSRISSSCTSYLSFDQIYSVEWKAVTLLMGAGACLLVLVALTAIFGFCITKLFNKAVVILTFTFQLLGVITFVVGLILFPAGIGEPVIRTFCDTDGPFELGSCNLGWAYILIIVGTAVAAVATAMSWFTLRWREKGRDSHSYSV